jgi:hypothetical protein
MIPALSCRWLLASSDRPAEEIACRAHGKSANNALTKLRTPTCLPLLEEDHLGFQKTAQ